MTKVKICGITNLEDALLSAKFGADALGFNFYEKSPRYIEPEKALEIIEQLPENVLKVGVFVNEDLEKIIEIAETAKLDALQLHGEEAPDFARELKIKTNLEIIKAFRVSPEFKTEDVLKYETDAILLDAYNQQEHGGTGETFDWEIAKKVQEISPKMYLAGGLSHENVCQAIYETKSFAVDVCSGVEEIKGKKDKVKLINFLTKAKTKLNQNSPVTFYNFLSAIHQRPLMYVNKKSLVDLSNLLYGFKIGLKISEAKFDTGKYFTDEIRVFAEEFFADKIPDAMGLITYILRRYDNNEEKSFDAFFALLEEFKLEKEDLSNE
ncbi:MAG: phosphoribosylanthranilate isomerase [Pyrinomonadaceae bacterium]|nr:phosphoribosylanthranilate isomerase [Pyrinomonadaceae bacterium]